MPKLYPAIMIRFEVPGLPIAKARARVTRKGFSYTPKKTADYEALVAMAARDALAEPMDGPVTVSVCFYMPIPASWSKKKQAAARSGDLRPTSRPDLDNMLKAITDSLNTIAYKDDSQIVSVSSAKRYADVPRADVMLGSVA